MHDTAYEHGRLFFELYGSESLRTVVELGSQDVNGSLRDHCPPGVHYIGLDMAPAKGVDLVINPAAPLPLINGIADAVVTSSAFEHDICFWDTFLELLRLLRPGGLLYVNAPSNGAFHRYPLDCWRFYPDAGVALVRWADRRGIEVALIESFIGLPQAEQWGDFVAVFRKAGGAPLVAKGRIADHAPAINIHDADVPAEAALRSGTTRMPDMLIADALREDLAAAGTGYAKLSAELAGGRAATTMARIEITAAQAEAATLRQHLHAAEQRIATLENDVAVARHDLISIQNSTSWRLTASLRRFAVLLRSR